MSLRAPPQPPTPWTRMECNTRRLQWPSLPLLRLHGRLIDGRYPSSLAPQIIQISRNDRACTLNHHSRWSMQPRLLEVAKVRTVEHLKLTLLNLCNPPPPSLLTSTSIIQWPTLFFPIFCAIYRESCSFMMINYLEISAVSCSLLIGDYGVCGV